jgi:4-azaleucine resistance transporter AzlC
LFEQRSPGRYQRLRRGLKATAPLALGVAPFGVAFGAVADGVMAGWQAMLMSVTVFSGTAQFVCASMLAQGAAAVPIVLTGVLINMRLLLMSAALTPHIKGIRPSLYPLLAHLLTDESFAVSIAEFETRSSDPWFYVGSGLAIWGVWQPATLVGLLFGAAIPQGVGLEFALPASLIVLLFLLLRDRLQVATAAGAALLAIALRPLVSDTWIAMVSTLAAATLAMIFKEARR